MEDIRWEWKKENNNIDIIAFHSNFSNIYMKSEYVSPVSRVANSIKLNLLTDI